MWDKNSIIFSRLMALLSRLVTLLSFSLCSDIKVSLQFLICPSCSVVNLVFFWYIFFVVLFVHVCNFLNYQVFCDQ